MMNMGEMSPHVVWQQYDVLHDLVSIDESIVLYCGRQSCKMFIKDKPIRYPYQLPSNLVSGQGYHEEQGTSGITSCWRNN